MTFNNFISLSMAVLALLTTSCKDCVDGSGNVISMDRQLSPFSKIRLEGSYNAYLIKDSIHYVRISTDDNVLPFIESNVTNGLLEIGEVNNKCIKSKHRADIFIHTPEIKQLTLEGSGSVNGQSVFSGNDLNILIKGSGDVKMDYNGSTVKAVIEGSGNVHLAGSANKQEFAINGSGYIHAEQMPSTETKASIHGSGNMEANVNTSLFVDISGSGTVWYSGNAAVQADISGSGKVKKK